MHYRLKSCSICDSGASQRWNFAICMLEEHKTGKSISWIWKVSFLYFSVFFVPFCPLGIFFHLQQKMILVPWQNYLFPLCITTGYYVTLKSISYLHNKDNLRIVFEFPAIKWCRISFIKCDYVSIQKLVRQKPIYAWQTGDSVFNHVSADVLNYFLVYIKG